jgi:hypothetical protein
MNYLAISKGYPPIVIKGEARVDRERYYSALETADKGFRKGDNCDLESWRSRPFCGSSDLLTSTGGVRAAFLCDARCPNLNLALGSETAEETQESMRLRRSGERVSG